MKAQISPEFRRALETEARRLIAAVKEAETKTFRVKIQAPGFQGIQAVRITKDNSPYFDWETEADFEARAAYSRKHNVPIADVKALWVREQR